MTAAVPELHELPPGLVLDRELGAWRGSEPYFPFACRRVLNRDTSIPLTFVAFNLLRVGGNDLTDRPYIERRKRLEALHFDGRYAAMSERFDDCAELFAVVCRMGLEGVVAKRRSGRG
jgi:bifunctional non-homologous end joining protein LigD